MAPCGLVVSFGREGRACIARHRMAMSKPDLPMERSRSRARRSDYWSGRIATPDSNFHNVSPTVPRKSAMAAKSDESDLEEAFPSETLSSSLPAGGPSAKPLSSADTVVAEIMRALYDGRFVAGQKLTEAELTVRFGVGRSTIREALKRLAAEGVVTLNLHRGANIRELTRTDVRDILEVVASLAGLSARLAAERWGGHEEVALHQTLASLKILDREGDAFELARMRNRFYRMLAQIAGNRELSRLIPLVQAHLVRVQFRAAYANRGDFEQIQDYARIVEAVLKRDGALAERLMRKHVLRVAELIEQLPDRFFA